MKPRLLDLFCCAGGATRGYQRAGFYVVGVDIRPQPNYVGDEFVQADALTFPLDGFEAVHASPPCQASSDLQKQNKRVYPQLIPPIRERLRDWGGVYVIENVEGAPLVDPVKICGASIPGLRVIRHRLFESNVPLSGNTCPRRHPLVFTYDKRKAHHGQLNQDESFVQVTGGGNCTVANKRAAMGVPWMTGAEANEAIPPAYAEFIGLQLTEHL